MTPYRIYDGHSGLSFSTFCQLVHGDINRVKLLTMDLIEAEEEAEKEMEEAKKAYEAAKRRHDGLSGNIVSLHSHTQKVFQQDEINIVDHDNVYSVFLKTPNLIAWERKPITIK
jgi:hypothetical protein